LGKRFVQRISQTIDKRTDERQNGQTDKQKDIVVE